MDIQHYSAQKPSTQPLPFRQTKQVCSQPPWGPPGPGLALHIARFKRGGVKLSLRAWGNLFQPRNWSWMGFVYINML